MKSINVENLKAGDLILVYDSGLCKLSPMEWIKCRVDQIDKYLVTLEYMEGNLKGIIFYEKIEVLRNPDYYRQEKRVK